MPKKFKTRPEIHNSHPAPITRRDFLARSVSATASMAFFPSVFSMLANAAYGADCSGSGSASMVGLPPFICVDLAGGGNIAGSNVMVGGRGGQTDFLASYTTLGISDNDNPNLGGKTSGLFPGGLQFHSASAFFEGLRLELQPAVAAQVDGAVFAAVSSDDSQANPHNPTYWIAKAAQFYGLHGQLTSLVGSTGTPSGGNSSVPPDSLNPILRPAQITNATAALNLVDVGLLPDWIGGSSNPANQAMNTTAVKARADRVLAAVNSMSSSALANFTAQDLPTQVSQLVNCGYLKSQDNVKQFLGGGPALDASQDQTLRPIFALDGSTNGGTRSTTAISKMQAAAGIAKLVIGEAGQPGLANAGTISYGGYDYHNQTRGGAGGTDDRDRDIGHVVGALFNAAAAKGKDLMVYLITDGGLSADPNTTNAVTINVNGTNTTFQKPQFAGDNGTKGATVLLAYKHSGLVAASKHQVGWYNANQSVDVSSSQVANNVENLAISIVANYMNLINKAGDLSNVTSNNPFGGSLGDILVFPSWSG